MQRAFPVFREGSLLYPSQNAALADDGYGPL